MDKNSLAMVLIGLLALAALAAVFYSSVSPGKAGYIGAMRFEGRIDDSDGKPVWSGSIVGIAGQKKVARGKIKGAYWLHFYTTFEKGLSWYKDKPVYIYVNGKLCTTLDLYKFVKERGGVIAQARLNLKCKFAQQ